MPDLELQRLANAQAELYTGLSHENLRIIMRLTRPVAATLPWVSLDGLLAWAVLVDLVGDDAYNRHGCGACELIDLPLPVEERGSGGKRYFAASFGVYQAIESVNRYKKRWDEQHDDLVDFKAKRQRIQTDGLFFKAKDMPVVLRDTRVMTFYAHGNRAEIEQLLQEHITHIGKLRGHGYGRIDSILIEPIADDYSCWWGEQPMRAIPVNGEDRPDLRTEFCGFRPPYWAPQNQGVCWTP